MNYYGSSEEHEPVTWFRGHAIYAAHFVVLVFVASLLVTTILMFAHLDWVYPLIAFNSTQVLHGQVWRIFTYGFWNPPTNLWFVINMLMLVWFGREVEKLLGRGKFLTLYTSIYLLQPLLFTALGKWLPTAFAGESSSFAIFIAFATLYPNVPVLFTLLAKWVALVLVGIYTLAALADHSWTTLLSLWATSGFAYGFIRFQRGELTIPRFSFPRRQPKLRVLPGQAKATAARPRPTSTSTAEIDALLDKIAQSGFASLTPKEKAKLEAARQELKNRSGR